MRLFLTHLLRRAKVRPSPTNAARSYLVASERRFTVRHAHGPELSRRARYVSRMWNQRENVAGGLFQHPVTRRARVEYH